jgi:hypothetical protein
MIEVQSGTTNYISFISRYNQISKWTIQDHNSKIIYSGDTTVIGMDGKIQLTGFTFQFAKNETYTLKAYYLYDGVYYLATHQMIRTWTYDERVDNYVQEEKPKNKFKNYGKN